jgi:hypothetical protein
MKMRGGSLMRKLISSIVLLAALVTCGCGFRRSDTTTTISQPTSSGQPDNSGQSPGSSLVEKRDVVRAPTEEILPVNQRLGAMGAPIPEEEEDEEKEKNRNLPLARLRQIIDSREEYKMPYVTYFLTGLGYAVAGTCLLALYMLPALAKGGGSWNTPS